MNEKDPARWHDALWKAAPVMGVLAFGLAAVLTQGAVSTLLWVITVFFVLVQDAVLLRWQRPRGPKK